MTETVFYETLGLAIKIAKDSFEEIKDAAFRKDLLEFSATTAIAELKKTAETHKFEPSYSLKYIIHWLTIAMIYDYMYEKKQAEKDGADKE